MKASHSKGGVVPLMKDCDLMILFAPPAFVILIIKRRTKSGEDDLDFSNWLC